MRTLSLSVSALLGCALGPGWEWTVPQIRWEGGIKPSLKVAPVFEVSPGKKSKLSKISLLSLTWPSKNAKNSFG